MPYLLVDFPMVQKRTEDENIHQLIDINQSKWLD